mmetsp:Transcript_19966/g.46907  ORF Transcript_19966/g.46907 Transcript_19966/m.46907 type:complete len:291 (+) Transcript_19966:1471-2343(+)
MRTSPSILGSIVMALEPKGVSSRRITAASVLAPLPAAAACCVMPERSRSVASPDPRMRLPSGAVRQARASSTASSAALGLPSDACFLALSRRTATLRHAWTIWPSVRARSRLWRKRSSRVAPSSISAPVRDCSSWLASSSAARTSSHGPPSAATTRPTLSRKSSEWSWQILEITPCASLPCRTSSLCSSRSRPLSMELATVDASRRAHSPRCRRCWSPPSSCADDAAASSRVASATSLATASSRRRRARRSAPCCPCCLSPDCWTTALPGGASAFDSDIALYRYSYRPVE